jgi:hypothetical protein
LRTSRLQISKSSDLRLVGDAKNLVGFR